MSTNYINNANYFLAEAKVNPNYKSYVLAPHRMDLNFLKSVLTDMYSSMNLDESSYKNLDDKELISNLVESFTTIVDKSGLQNGPSYTRAMDAFEALLGTTRGKFILETLHKDLIDSWSTEDKEDKE